jgi:hypothetical protein
VTLRRGHTLRRSGAHGCCVGRACSRERPRRRGGCLRAQGSSRRLAGFFVACGRAPPRARHERRCARARSAHASRVHSPQLLEHSQDLFMMGNGNDCDFESASVQRLLGYSHLGCGRAHWRALELLRTAVACGAVCACVHVLKARIC